MAITLNDFFPIVTEEEKDYKPNFHDTLVNYLSYWRVFLISLFIFTAIAFYTVIRTGPVYEINASLVIKDEKKEPDEKGNMQDLEVSNSPRLAENELQVLKSRTLILKVVNDLQLWVSYNTQAGLISKDLYNSSPVSFKLLDSTGNLSGHIFKIKIKDDKSFFLIKSDDIPHEYPFGTKFVNSFGIWEITPLRDVKNFIGSEITISLSDPNAVAEYYQKKITAELTDKLASLITLTLKDGVEQQGIDILNELMHNYKTAILNEKNGITQKTLGLIDKHIVSIENDLNNSEKNVEKYRSDKGITDISLQSKADVTNASDAENKLNDINIKLNVIEGIEASLNSSHNIQSASAALGDDYPTLNTLIDKLSELELQHDKLLGTVPESNPLFDPLNRQIKTAKVGIRENIENIKAYLLTVKNKLKQINSGFRNNIRDIPVQERGLIDKTRQQSIKETLYVYLLKKREEVSLNYVSILPDVKIVDFAYASSPKTLSIIAYGGALFISLLIPGGIIGGRNLLSGKFTVLREIDSLGIPILGELAHTKTQSQLVVLERKDFAIEEQFRDLRTNLSALLSKTGNGKVIMVTSSIPNEGKSFICDNLGLVLAASGKKTVIIDMDLRNPNTNKTFDLPDSYPGVSNFLNGQVSIEEIVQHPAIHTGLDIISSGDPIDEPSELLEQEQKVRDLYDWLRNVYDFVLIDTPPLRLVTDAKILAYVSDVTLYVVRQGYTDKSLSRFIKSIFKQQRFNGLNIVVNGVKNEKRGYGYGYGYSYKNARRGAYKKNNKKI